MRHHDDPEYEQTKSNHPSPATVTRGGFHHTQPREGNAQAAQTLEPVEED